LGVLKLLLEGFYFNLDEKQAQYTISVFYQILVILDHSRRTENDDAKIY